MLCGLSLLGSGNPLRVAAVPRTNGNKKGLVESGSLDCLPVTLVPLLGLNFIWVPLLQFRAFPHQCLDFSASPFHHTKAAEPHQNYHLMMVTVLQLGAFPIAEVVCQNPSDNRDQMMTAAFFLCRE